MDNHLRPQKQMNKNSTLSGPNKETDEQTNQLTDEPKTELTNKPINQHMLKADRSFGKHARRTEPQVITGRHNYTLVHSYIYVYKVPLQLTTPFGMSNAFMYAYSYGYGAGSPSGADRCTRTYG